MLKMLKMSKIGAGARAPIGPRPAFGRTLAPDRFSVPFLVSVLVPVSVVDLNDRVPWL